MGLRILKQMGLYIVGAAVLISPMSYMDVWAAEKYPLTYENVKDEDGTYMVLTEEEKDYTVQPGDSLWKIAIKQLGDERYYLELADANRDVFSDPNLIYPGMALKMSRTGYIFRKEAQYGGIQMREYSMDLPYGWTIGMNQSGNAGANMVMSGDGEIACLVQDKTKEVLDSVIDWEKCTQQIAEYVKKNYNGQVSDLSFDHYYMEDQEDASGELYLYSYIWHISPDDYPNLTCKVCVGLKLTDHIQAEFVGYALDDYDIQGCVRYVTASFEEHSNSESAEEFTVNDSNMSIVPESEWELEGMYNSFAYVDEFFTSLLNKATGAEEETKSSREKLMDRMSRD